MSSSTDRQEKIGGSVSSLSLQCSLRTRGEQGSLQKDCWHHTHRRGSQMNFKPGPITARTIPSSIQCFLFLSGQKPLTTMASAALTGARHIEHILALHHSQTGKSQRCRCPKRQPHKPLAVSVLKGTTQLHYQPYTCVLKG